jgi:hypothetical protein
MALKSASPMVVDSTSVRKNDADRPTGAREVDTHPGAARPDRKKISF